MSNRVKARGVARSQVVVLGLADGTHRQVDLGRRDGGDVIFCSQCGTPSPEGSAPVCGHDIGGLCVHRLREAARRFPGAILDMA